MGIYPIKFTAIDRTPYTYFIRHKITGKKYYGSRTAKGCNPAELWVTYFTTSKTVRQLIKVEGKQSFDFKVARVFSDSIKCLKHENRFLLRHNAADSVDWYNRSNGATSFSTAGTKRTFTKIHKKRIALARTGTSRTVETKLKISNAHKNHKDRLRLNSEHSNRMKGRVAWNKGCPQTEQHRLRNSSSHLGHTVTKKQREKQSAKILGRVHIHHKSLLLNKLVHKEELPIYVDQGFELGQLPSI